jgi:anti-sigma regulatory factor (Ser/Thr protein kinase)
VDLSILPSPSALRIDVSDEGPGFESPEPPRHIDTVHVLQSGGRGLAAMQSVADEITVHGGTVSLIFR